MENQERVNVLEEAVPYIIKFHGKTFVVKIGGELVGNLESLDSITRDIVFLHHVGIDVVVVHGGGPQADELSDKLGIKPKIINGLRVTDSETLEIAKWVYAGQVNTDLTAALRKHELMTPDGPDLEAKKGGVGLTGGGGHLIRVKKKEMVNEVDLGYVGEIEKVNPEILKVLIKERYIPVVACLGFDENGTVYNINADAVASEIAIEMEAEKLISLTNMPGVLKNLEDLSSRISYLDVEGAKTMLTEGAITGGMIPKLESCIKAVEGKGGKRVKRAHILDGTKKGSLLLEVFTRSGSGTMIVTPEEAEKYREEEYPEDR
jgi:acetylglutamate kinase